MKIKTATFVISNTSYEKCPTGSLKEFAFIGRSNVGKSSLINMLTNHKKLAKVSGKPGKTQLINHFLINDEWHLVDLPGYGWAQVSKESKAKWGEMIHDYLLYRENLITVFVLVDSRLDPQKVDLDFINWLGEKGVPFSIVFTKADKQSINKTQSAVARYRKTLKTYWEELPAIFITSSQDKTGKEEVLNYIEDLTT